MVDPFTFRAPGPIGTSGMDQTFDYRAAPVPLWRRLSPRAIALAVAACVVLSGLVSFSRWVIDSERRSIERAAVADRATSAVGTISGADGAPGVDALDDRLAIDAGARADARTALAAAQRAARGRPSFLDAGPGHLAPRVSSLILVDGPSQAPGIVSVASTRGAWGAASMGASGTCYLLRFAPGEGVTYDTGLGTGCSGEDALARARGTAW